MSHSGVHDSSLVALSVAIAVFSSYTALDLAARMRSSKRLAYWAWLAGAAVTMGGGIWSMHFVAMLAYTVPGVEVSYDLTLTLISLALPVTVTALGFTIVNRREAGLMDLMLAGLLMGAGIAGMHYIGMAAMRMPADLVYDRYWVAVSLFISVGASTVALWLAFRHSRLLVRVAAAVVMGLAVSGMHYAAMQGLALEGHTHEGAGASPAGVGQTVLALWVATSTFAILILAVVAAMLDRHYAQQAEHEAAALRASEQRFRLLIQSVTDYAIFMIDPSGNVGNWNEGAARIQGYQGSDIIGRPISTFYTDEDKANGKAGTALRVAAETGKFEDEGWRVRKDGSRFWASVVINAIRNEAGELVGFAKVTRDISERRAAQEDLDKAREALFQSQKLEAIGQLTGGVAHDFNNLLMAVLGSLELIKKRAPDDPRIVRLLDNAITGAQRGAALTQRMLAFARQQHLRPEPVDLPGLVEGITDLLKRSIGPAHRIETRFPPDLPPALVDAHQLELAILNLVVNARDAMPGGGTIVISGSERKGEAEGRRVCVSVSDSGVGMDADTLARAVEPFFTTKGVGKGTGLGLSMVQGLAQQSKGRLVITSAPGRGTVAEVELPVGAMPDAAPNAAEPVASPSPQRGLRILLVDDDPLVLENTAAMLEDLGHRIWPVSSGTDAIDLIEQGAALDLVLADYAMPGMTGSALSERLAVSHPSLPVVLATGYADVGEEISVQLRKPYTQAELQAALFAATKREAGPCSGPPPHADRKAPAGETARIGALDSPG